MSSSIVKKALEITLADEEGLGLGSVNNKSSKRNKQIKKGMLTFSSYLFILYGFVAAGGSYAITYYSFLSPFHCPICYGVPIDEVSSWLIRIEAVILSLKG